MKDTVESIEKEVSLSFLRAKIAAVFIFVIIAVTFAFSLSLYQWLYLDTHIGIPFMSKFFYDFATIFHDKYIGIGIAFCVGCYIVNNLQKYFPDFYYSAIIYAPLMKNLYMLRFCDNMQYKSLQLSVEALGNPLYKAVIKETLEEVDKGKNVAEALKEADTGELFDENAIVLLAVSEEFKDFPTIMGKGMECYADGLKHDIEIFNKRVIPVTIWLLIAFFFVLSFTLFFPFVMMQLLAM
mgnify:FL=1